MSSQAFEKKVIRGCHGTTEVLEGWSLHHMVTVAWLLHPSARYTARAQYLSVEAKGGVDYRMIRPSGSWVSLPEKEAAAPDSGQLVRFYSQDMVLLWADLAPTIRLLCSPVEHKQFHRTASDKATLWLMKTKTRWPSNHISTQIKCDHGPNHTMDQTPPTPANEWPPVLYPDQL